MFPFSLILSFLLLQSFIVSSTFSQSVQNNFHVRPSISLLDEETQNSGNGPVLQPQFNQNNGLSQFPKIPAQGLPPIPPSLELLDGSGEKAIDVDSEDKGRPQPSVQINPPPRSTAKPAKISTTSLAASRKFLRPPVDQETLPEGSGVAPTDKPTPNTIDKKHNSVPPSKGTNNKRAEQHPSPKVDTTSTRRPAQSLPPLPCNEALQLPPVQRTRRLRYPPRCNPGNTRLYRSRQCAASTNQSPKECFCVNVSSGKVQTTFLAQSSTNCSTAVFSVVLAFVTKDLNSLTIPASSSRTRRDSSPVTIPPNSPMFSRLSQRLTNVLSLLFRPTRGHQWSRVDRIVSLGQPPSRQQGVLLQAELELMSQGHRNLPDVEMILKSRIDEGNIEGLPVLKDKSSVRLSRSIPEDEVVAQIGDDSNAASESEYVEDDNTGINSPPDKPDNIVKPEDPNDLPETQKSLTATEALLRQPGIIAAMVGGGIAGFLLAILLILFCVYRLRKRDEGSYKLDEPKKNLMQSAYSRAPTREFYA